MRLLIAMMKHETNTFSPIRTDWRRFEEWGAHLGDAARRAYEGTAMPMGAYLALAREAGAEVVTPIAAEAMPSGPVTAEAYELMTSAILDAVRGGCDAAMLDLHGAMVAETTADGEGTLLARMRALAPDLPIAVTCAGSSVRITRAGAPMISECSGNVLPSVITAPAPTMLLRPILAPFITIEPMPTRAPSSSVQPCRITL